MTTTIDIVRYTRDKNNNPNGCIIASKDQRTNEVFIAGSKCHRNDTFIKTKGLDIATGRVHAMMQGRKVDTPSTLLHEIDKMESRARKYFKDSTTFHK